MGFLTIAGGIYSVSGGGGEGTVSLSANATFDANDGGNTVDWHPSGKYIALGCEVSSSYDIGVYSWDGSSITNVESVSTSMGVVDVKWSANGDYLAVCITGSASDDIFVYSWNGSNTLTLVESINVTAGEHCARWSPDGNFLAQCIDLTGTNVIVYSWNGYDTLTSVETYSHSEAVSSLEWSNCGKYLAICSYSYLKIFEWNGVDTLTLKDTVSFTTTKSGMQWSLDDDYLFVATSDNTKTLVAYSWNGTSLTEETYATDTNLDFMDVSISNGGGYLFVTASYSTVSVKTYIIAYSWDSSTNTLTKESTLSWNDRGGRRISVSRDNKYIATATKYYNSLYSMRIDNTGLSEVGSIMDLTSSATINSGGDAWPCDWHSNGNYIAYSGNMTGKELCVASWNGSSALAEVETVNAGGGCYGLHWHPSTDYLASVEYNDSTNSLVVYSWNGTDTLASVATAGNTGGNASVHWHSNGNYVAVGSYNTSKSIVVYSWNGSNTLTEVASVNTGSAEYGVRWSNDGNYLAVCGGESAKDLKVYGWNGTDTLTFKDSHSFGTTGNGYSPRWKSDDTYIFASAASASDHQVFALTFNGTTLTEKATLDFAETVRGLDILDDKYISLGVDWATAAATNETLKIYEYDFDCDAFIMKDGYTTNARGMNIGDFDNTGQYIACPTLTSSTSVTLRILKLERSNIPTEWIENTNHSIPSTGYVFKVKYGSDGYWVAGGADVYPSATTDFVLYSTDPTGTFSNPTYPTNKDLTKGILYDGSNWAAAGYSDYPIYKATPPSGTWSSGTRTVGTGNSYAFAYGNGYYVSGTSVSLKRVRYSTSLTGAYYTATGVPNYDIRCVHYGSDGYWIVGGSSGTLAYSTSTPISFTTLTSPFTSSYHTIDCYYNGTHWVITSNNGEIAYATNPTASGNWTKISSPGPFVAGDWINAVYYANGIWLIAGLSGKMAYATDPTSSSNWTTITTGITSQVTGISYGNGYWMAGCSSAGNSDKLYYSKVST